MDTVHIKLVVRVDDRDKLHAYAAKRCMESFQTDITDLYLREHPVGRDVLEALIVSNENPPMDEYGIDLLDYSFSVVEGE